MTTANFRVSTDILQRLGEELITSFDQGIVELVKNSYDADALNCTVELSNTDKPGGTVVIADDGDGMNLEDIRDGWLVIGRSRKNPRLRTRLNRLPAGSKGLGRIGALRMGDEVVLISRPIDQPGIEYSVNIHWRDFTQSDVVEDVEFDIRSSDTDQPCGSRIEIRNLRESVSEREAHRLARALVLLSDPFGDPSGFTPSFVASSFAELEQLVSHAYFDDCAFKLVATLDERGYGSANVYDRSDRLRWATSVSDLDRQYKAPAAKFELWVYLLAASSFTGRSANVGEVRSWLREVGGVHLYHRGLRVRPYGDPGHDWLDMNLARSRDPELRPSTNTSVGRVIVTDEAEELLQKTDRTGFVENLAFRELRRFAIEILDWMQAERLAEREASNAKKKEQSSNRRKLASKSFRDFMDRLPEAKKPEVQAVAREFEAATTTELNQLREEVGLYQTMASVGTAVSVFAHEIEGPASEVVSSANAVERRAKRKLRSEYHSVLGNQVNAVKKSAELLRRFATLPLLLLKKSKRRRSTLDIDSTIGDVVSLFEPYLNDARVVATPELGAAPARIHSSVAAIEAIISNLLTNSVKAFKRNDAALAVRTLVIRTSANQTHVVIAVLDSGPGIPKRLGERIWLPGITSDENGTGLGLTIVRDTVKELGGNVTATPNGELGGAEFIVELPRASTG